MCEAHTDPGGDHTDPQVMVTGDILATVMGWLSDQVVGGATTFYIGPDLVRMWPTRSDTFENTSTKRTMNSMYTYILYIKV